MILNIIFWLLLVLVTILFGYLLTRAWRAQNALVKWGGTILAGLMTLVMALISLVTAGGFYQSYAPRGSAPTDLKVAMSPEQVARGEHLANTMCVSCHSMNNQLPLSGGRDIGKDSPLPIGSYIALNLTPGGPLRHWSDGEIMRALTEGVDRTGSPLAVMSSNAVRYLSDEDKQAVIAYLRSQPAVTTATVEPDQPNLLAFMLVGAGVVKLTPPLTGPVVAPPKGATAEYGKYIVDYSDCRSCHGQDLTGGTDPTMPHGANLRVVRGWTAEQFISTFRTGIDPAGHVLAPMMPWMVLARLDDVELTAIYTYLHGLGTAQ